MVRTEIKTRAHNGPVDAHLKSGPGLTRGTTYYGIIGHLFFRIFEIMIFLLCCCYSIPSARCGGNT